MSKKPALRLLGKMCRTDLRTVFGTNLRNIAIDCKVNIDSLTPNIVKNAMSYFMCPDNELWRIPLLQNLINIRSNEWFLENFENNEIENIITDVCTN